MEPRALNTAVIDDAFDVAAEYQPRLCADLEASHRGDSHRKFPGRFPVQVPIPPFGGLVDTALQADGAVSGG